MPTVALLDVDDTLLFNFRDLNHALLTSLKEKGVTDIYLFTNMDLSDIKYFGSDFSMSRYELIQEMKKLGLNVAGTIMPTDAGNFDTDSSLKPVGTAFNELYMPLMEQAISSREGPDLNTFKNIELAINYFTNDIKFTSMRAIMSARLESPAGEKVVVTLPELELTNKHTGVKALIETADLATYMNQAGFAEIYSIKTVYASRTVEVEGAGYPAGTENKALMMEAFLKQFAGDGELLSIVYFDDSSRQLSACELAVSKYNQSHNHPVYLETHQVSRKYDQANNNKFAYLESIDKAQKKQQLPQIINTALSDLNHVRTKFLYPQKEAAIFLKAHLRDMNTTQLITLAKIALNGNSTMFNPANLNTAFYCMRNALLVAKNEHEEAVVFKAVKQLFSDTKYQNFKSQPCDRDVKEQFDNLIQVVFSDNSNTDKFKAIEDKFTQMKDSMGASLVSTNSTKKIHFFGPSSSISTPSCREEPKFSIK